MNESPSTPRAGSDPPARAGSDIVSQFEQEWKRALVAGNPPDIETFLKDRSDSDRRTLRVQLEAIQRQFQAQRTRVDSAGGDATVAFSGSPSATGEAPKRETRTEPVRKDAGDAQLDPTVNLDSQIPPAVPQDTVPIGPQSSPWLQATVNLDSTAPRKTPDQTIALVEAASPREAGRSSESYPEVAGYRIDGVLGRGGMGVVYRATDIKLGRVVALKMIIAGAHAGPDQLARFYTEAQAVAHLQHPNIIQIYEIGEQEGLPYFSLEYVDGGSLAQKAAGKPQPDAEAAEMVETLAAAIHYAHEHGVVHRDLKPANILLTSSSVPKITDFGLAKRLEGESSSQTRSGAILGTPSYMAPEQALGEVRQVGPLTDVYSLGAILYELITGRPPFLAPNPMDTVLQVIREEPVAPTQLQPKVSRDLETICLKCLQKEPAKRYASARELAEDLRRFRAGEPITARPIGAPERVWRWCRRNPRVAILSAAVLLLLVASTAGAVVAALTINTQKNLAIDARNLAQSNEREATNAKALAESNAAAARAAERQAAANEKLAADQAELALDALKTVVSEIDRELRDRPAMRPLRTKLLEMALEKVDRVASSDESASTLERIRAAVFQQKVLIYSGLGKSAESQEQQQKAHDILQRLFEQDLQGVDADKALGNLALSFDTLADLISGRDPERAREYYEKALSLREQLLAQPKSDFYPSLARENFVANSYDKLGIITLRTGNHRHAIDLHQKALQLRRHAAAAAPDNTEFLPNLGNTLALLASVHQQRSEWEQAREYLSNCLEVRTALATSDPLSISYKFSLALTQRSLGDVSILAREYERAIPHYESTLSSIQELVQSDGSQVYRQNLAGVQYRLGTAVLLARGAKAADEYFQKSLELYDDILASGAAKTTGFKNEWMLVLARCGKHEQAAALAEELSFTEPQQRWLFQAACGYSLCIAGSAHLKSEAELTGEDRARQAQYAERAIQAVATAIEKGFKNVSSLESDPELAYARQYPGFQRLIDELRARVNP